MVTTTKLEYINRVIDECLSEDGEALELNGKFIGDEGVEALVSTNRDFSVENLDLSRNKLTWRGAQHLFQSQSLQILKYLAKRFLTKYQKNLKKCVYLAKFWADPVYFSSYLVYLVVVKTSKYKF